MGEGEKLTRYLQAPNVKTLIKTENGELKHVNIAVLNECKKPLHKSICRQ